MGFHRGPSVFELKLLQSLFHPRAGRRSNALLALLAMGVIALVVWLVLVFFSVTEGLEVGWVQRLTALHGAVRITPTQEYAKSYAYQVETWSGITQGHHRSILEVWQDPRDTWDPEEDPELPADLEAMRQAGMPSPILALKEALHCVEQEGIPIEAHPYQGAPGMLLLATRTSTMQQPVLLASWDTLPSAVKRLGASGTDLEHLDLKTGALFPKAFSDAGAQIGDQGWITVQKFGAQGVTDRRIPLQVEGFYDAGIMPVGGRILLASPALLRRLGHLTSPEESPQLHGIQIAAADLQKSQMIKEHLVRALEQTGGQRYWRVESYRELDFAQELFQQFESDRMLFSLIALIVLTVACANIISFLVLLVHERRKEIGILRAMGATELQMAVVFGGAGLAIGLGGALLGTGLALFTLWKLDHLVQLLTWLQGHPAFHPAFFGGSLPNHCSARALQFVWYATPCLAILSGMLPALRACRLQPSLILKSESS
ncbi:MAG: ABC transporter permease [Chlamydiia bacterium]